MGDTSEYFTGLADVYDRHRPGYPTAALDAMLAGLPRPPAAADVGCGTGISTRLLAAAGATVTGVDPNDDMLDRAAAASEGDASIGYCHGTAEATGLDDASVDLVLCAQAFHWFDDSAALAEFHRILRPGGRVALLWNVRPADDAFGAAYEALIERAQEDTVGRGRLVRRNRGYDLGKSPLFTNARETTFDNPHRLDEPSLLGRARSASYFPREPEPRAAMEAALRELFARYQENGVVVLRQFARLIMGERV